ncbi:MAG: TRIC cation channel family protein, partial [Thermoleophilia bacterium]|nr:TRIC cation channel family protein [Thermoleophilia bacterium]
MDQVVSLPLYLDLTAVFLGGLSGSLHAVRRGFAVTGLVAMAIAAGLGGGILRDLLLQSGPPVALTRPAYLPTVLAAAGVGFFFGSLVRRFRKPIILMDAVWLGLY